MSKQVQLQLRGANEDTLVAEEAPTEVSLKRAFLAEFFGTFLLVLIGDGAVAQSVVSPGVPFLSVNFAYGMAVMIGAFTAGCVSGAHLNPAVSLALATLGRFPWKRLLPFALAQTLGSFCAAVIVFGVYFDGINKYDHGRRAVSGQYGTAGIFCTFPAEYMSTGGAFFDQIVGTFILMTGISAINDDRNISIPLPLKPFFVGLLLLSIGASFGVNTGYAINPARDFGPRVFTAMAYGDGVWTAHNNYWWVPVLAPFIGAVLGGWAYNIFIERLHNTQAAAPPPTSA